MRPATVAFEGGSLEVRVPSSTAAAASYPLTIDPILSTFSVAFGNFVQFDPDVSFNAAGVYTYTWEHAFSLVDHDVWTRIRTVGGALGAYVAQDVTTADWRWPANADNNKHDRVLVVAEAPGFLGYLHVRGRLFSPIANANVSGQFDVVPYIFGQDARAADVGGDPRPGTGDQFCVVYSSDLFTSDGILRRMVHATTLATSAGSTVEGGSNYAPAISKACGLQVPRWFVAWQDSLILATIGARLIEEDGSFGSPVLAVASPPFPQSATRPDMAGDGTEALVVYEQGGDIHGAYLSPSGSSFAVNAINLTANEPGSDPGEWQGNPTVGVDECRFVYAYAESYDNSATDLDIRLAAVRPGPSAFVWDQGHVLVPNAFSTAAEDHPRLASRWTGGGSGPEHALAFDDNNSPGTGWYEIHAALYVAHSGALSTATVPTSCGATPPTILASGTSALNGTLTLQATGGQGGALLLLVGPPGATPL